LLEVAGLKGEAIKAQHVLRMHTQKVQERWKPEGDQQEWGNDETLNTSGRGHGKEEYHNRALFFYYLTSGMW
jgi:hypothetical protein